MSTQQSLNTSARREDPWPRRLYGKPVTVIENPETHEHSWLNWQPRPGSYVYGVYCLGCNTLLVD